MAGADPSEIDIDDEDVYVGYRREHILKVDPPQIKDADELPEHIRYRLFLARTVALMKYKEKWG